MGETYKPEDIQEIAMPQWSMLPTGEWVREWHVRLKSPTTERALAALENLSGPGTNVEAHLLDDFVTLKIKTTTTLNALSDEVFFFAAYRMLKFIDIEVGAIDTIQGQPRRMWRPFRNT